MVNCGEYVPPTDWTPKKGDELQSIGILSPVESHFDINKRTAFFIGTMTKLVDSVASKPERFADVRNTNPMRHHPAYRLKKHPGIAAKDVEAITTSSLSSVRLSEQFGLPEETIRRIRSSVNFVPFYYRSSTESRNEDGSTTVSQLPDQKWSIQQPRMSAFDIAYPPYISSGTETQRDHRKEWIIKNLDGLSIAIGGKKGSQRKRIIHHLCYALANIYERTSSPIPYASMKSSIGRTLAVSILRTPGIAKETRLEDHQLDWRVLFELMKVDSDETRTFDEFIQSITDDITQCEDPTTSFGELFTERLILNDFLSLMKTPAHYLFKEHQIFSHEDFTNLPTQFTRNHFYFLNKGRGKDLSLNQRRYGLQVTWGFIRCMMFYGGYEISNEIDESIPIEERIFTRRD